MAEFYLAAAEHRIVSDPELVISRIAISKLTHAYIELLPNGFRCSIKLHSLTTGEGLLECRVTGCLWPVSIRRQGSQPHVAIPARASPQLTWRGVFSPR